MESRQAILRRAASAFSASMSPFLPPKVSGSPFLRGMMWKWMWRTVCPAASPLHCSTFAPAAPASNPLLYAKALIPACNVVEKASSDGKQTTVTLTPKDQSIGINRFVLIVRNSDQMPLQAEIKEGKKISTLKFKEPKFVNTKEEYVIKADKETFVNDMRL